MTENKKPQLHVSGLETLSKCGILFENVYMKKIRIPPGVAAKVGTSAHRSIEKNLKNVIEKGSLLSLEEIGDIARDTMVKEWNSGVMLNDDEVKAGIEKTRAKAIDKAVKLSRLHATDVAPKIKPTHIERKGAIELSGYPMDLAFQIDIQEGLSKIRDSKTTGKSPAEDIADKSLQLSAYALGVKILDGKIPSEVQLDFLIDNKIPEYKKFVSTRDENDFRVLLNRIERAIQIIEKGAFFPASQNEWICTPKWCGFFNNCPYTQKPKQFQI